MDSTLKTRKNPKHHPTNHPSRKRRRKKKGRPSKADLARRHPIRSLPEPEAPRRRTLRPLRRRRGLEDEEPYFYEYDGEEEDEEDQQEKKHHNKKQKKLTLVLKLNKSSSGGRSSDLNCSATSSLEDDREHENKVFIKRRRIDRNDCDDDVDDDDYDGDARWNKSDDGKDEKRNWVPKSADSLPGLRSDSSSSTPLPDRKMLEFVLHKLQKKDTYGVYAEPVDPKELPDYHDIIEHPMDFGTIRKKLASGAYTLLEQFESDVFLVCTNAMQYNAPDTIYYKQARAIQELAKKRFEKLRVVSCNEMELESLQKIRPNSMERKPMKKSMSMSAQEPVGSDFSSGATLANTRDTCTGPNTAEAVAFDKSGSVDGFVMDGNSFLEENNHVTAEELSVKGFQSKFGRKLFAVDENRRSTYNASDQPVTRTESVLATFESEMKQLVVVGLNADHSYARSLARFAATLGPVAWRIASGKIEQALPAGYKFGRGWVGEYEPLQTPVLLLENHSWRQPAHNLIAQHKSQSNKVKEITEKFKVTRGGGPTSVTVKSETSAGAVCKHMPKASNLNDELARFGIVGGTNPNVRDIRLHQQNPLNIDFPKPGRNVLKQIEVSCSTSVSNVISDDASQKHRHHSQGMTSRMLEMVSRSRSLMHSVPFKRTGAPKPIHNSDNASQSGTSVRMDGGADDALPNVRIRNTLDSTSGSPSLPFVSDCQAAGALGFFGHGNNKQSLDDQVKVMMSSGKMANQPKSLNSPMANKNQVMPSVVSPRSAAAAAALAWMSTEAQGLKLTDISPSQMKIAAASLYNPAGELPSLVSRSHEYTSGSGRSQSENRFAGGQSLTQPVHVGEDLRFQSSRLAACHQFPAADLSSRFPMESPWRGLVPHYPHQRQKTEMSPPDLNISFQSSGSPVQQQSSGVQVDSQQPDLALQL